MCRVSEKYRNSFYSIGFALLSHPKTHVAVSIWQGPAVHDTIAPLSFITCSGSLATGPILGNKTGSFTALPKGLNPVSPAPFSRMPLFWLNLREFDVTLHRRRTLSEAERGDEPCQTDDANDAFPKSAQNADGMPTGVNFGSHVGSALWRTERFHSSTRQQTDTSAASLFAHNDHYQTDFGISQPGSCTPARLTRFNRARRLQTRQSGLGLMADTDSRSNSDVRPVPVQDKGQCGQHSIERQNSADANW